MERDDHEEILRLRDRQHDIEGTVAGLKFMVDDLREWRAQARLQLEDLVKADELADAVAQRLNAQAQNALTAGEYRLHRWQVWLGGVAIVGAIVSPILSRVL